MTLSSGAADQDTATAGSATDTEDVPDWLAAMRPATPLAAVTPPVPAMPVVTSVPRPEATAPGRQQEPVPVLLAEDDLPAWLTRLADEGEATAAVAAPAPPTDGVPSWLAPSGTAPAGTASVTADVTPTVWGAPQTKSAPTEATGAAIFASLAATPVAIEVEEPASAAPTPASTPAAVRQIPWWWFAAAAVAVLLLVVVLLVMTR